MRITIILAVLVFSAGIFLGSCGAVFAKEDDIGSSQIHPASPLYFLKAIRENLENVLAQTPRVKLIRSLEFGTRRLREVKTLVNINREDFIPSTLEKYWFHIKSIPDTQLTDKDFELEVKNSLAVHLKELEKVYEKLSDSRAKMFTRSTINKIIQRADIPEYARTPACYFLQKEASQSALNETEKAVLKERVENCFNYLK